MKVLFCGDRHWQNYNSILDIVKRLKVKYGDIIIIEGECDGADKLAKKAAVECDIPCRSYPADWDKYGNAAGPIRNQQMLDSEHPEMVIAFHSNIEYGKGTKDMVNRAQKHGIETYIITK